MGNYLKISYLMASVPRKSLEHKPADDRYSIAEGVGLLLKVIIADIRELEIYRTNLFQIPNMSVTSLFRALDLTGKGYLTRKDIYIFLRYYKFNIADGEIDYIYSLFSDERSEQLRYEDFLHLITPTTDRTLSEVVLRRRQIDYLIDDCLPQMSEAFGTLIIKYMDAYHHIDEAKHRLYSFFDFKIDHDFLYALLDPKHKGRLSFEDFNEFFSDLAIDFTREDFEALLAYFAPKHTDLLEISREVFIDRFVVQRLYLIKKKGSTEKDKKALPKDKNPFAEFDEKGVDEWLARTYTKPEVEHRKVENTDRPTKENKENVHERPRIIEPHEVSEYLEYPRRNL
eukprot:TRINITY_DN9780_c0_g1_i2.p1 TRINITY_DN9780_c0_g1~~TRINITY_DN9780_c0_g1_i2.p1  ORF type:complete len:341 (-),score=63.14 TRINITY_DN9780_c0_g1_i2:125-1147(-)